LITYQLTPATAGSCDIGVTNNVLFSEVNSTFYSSLGGYNNLGWNVPSDVQVEIPQAATLALFRSQGVVDTSSSIMATVCIDGVASTDYGMVMIPSIYGWTVDMSHTVSVVMGTRLAYEFTITQSVGGTASVSQSGLTATFSA
jgi:hypothetical protein